MNKNHYLQSKSSLLAFLGGTFLIGNLSAQTDKPLNIVFIMSDDHTQQAISAYDDRYGETTPNIDEIADEGVVFTNSFVANSISGPSRACMLTGKHSHKNGKINNMRGNEFDGSQLTFPKLLHNAGYQTALIGKWHLESNPTGFDYWEILPGQGDYYSPVMYTKDKRTKYDNRYATDLITDKSIDWLEHRDTKKPFCLMIHHKATHRNFMAKTSDLYAFEDKTYPYPDNLFDNYEHRPAAAAQEMGIADYYTWDYDLKVPNPDGTPSPYGAWYKSKDKNGNWQGTYARMNTKQRGEWDHFYDSIYNDLVAQNLKGDELTKWKYQRYVKDYLKTAKALDDNIGRVIDYLRANNLMENTIIVYTSDQGFYMGEHGWFDKRFMYEESMRTPLIVRLPKHYNAHGKVKALVQNIDHAPTFLQLAGLEVPEEIQGTSYLPLLQGHQCKQRKALYYHFYEYPAEHAVKRHYGIRTKRYKLIHFYNDIDEWELYDLKKDPQEMYNLIDNPKYAKRIKKLKKQLWELQVKFDDPIREKYPLLNE